MQRLVLAGLAVIAVWAAPARAAEPWVGQWAASPAGCNSFGGNTAATAPLIVTDTNLRWYPGSCRIGKMYKLGQTAYIQARCFGHGVGDTPVTLDPRPGDRMRVTWNGKTVEVRRCK